MEPVGRRAVRFVSVDRQHSRPIPVVTDALTIPPGGDAGRPREDAVGIRSMSAVRDPWRLEDCTIVGHTEHDAYRVFHRPSRTEILVDRLRVEAVRQNVSYEPADGRIEDRRTFIAVRLAWEDATTGS